MLKINIAPEQILNTQLNTFTMKQNKSSVVHALLRAISFKRVKIWWLFQHVILSIYVDSLKTTKPGTKQILEGEMLLYTS